jgi:hypothetical protein
MNRTVVYTAIYGDKDDLDIPKEVEGFDFVYFTGDGGLLSAKKPKILPHRYFKEYDYSMWVDGNIKLIGNPKPVIDKYMKNFDIVMLTHPAESLKIFPHIYKEANICIDQYPQYAKELKRQVKAYKKDGCPAEIPIVAAGIIIRNHNHPTITAFDEAWWNEIIEYSPRDQISFAYLAWKLKLRYGKLDNIGLGASWFRYVGIKYE